MIASVCKQKMNIDLELMLVSQLRLYIHGHDGTKSPFKLYLVLVLVEKTEKHLRSDMSQVVEKKKHSDLMV